MDFPLQAPAFDLSTKSQETGFESDCYLRYTPDHVTGTTIFIDASECSPEAPISKLVSVLLLSPIGPAASRLMLLGVSRARFFSLELHVCSFYAVPLP
jgi:hypothetical protein